ncbi:dihydrolipoamide acyltransferase [Naegleria gruberi]|uniref:Dihydrolipoamide acetyltransferase component of pyruvate dehydrogenase complex n=2 Tax=Naegleria gruberi TaxID=5762 RepID=D2V5C4_NAEGR|nr:dihydrolipoamide acyltransferase [Naegleria gruberi]EFC47929.1 dihydrolipoamide acyltransferase [Naegleria gruberi]|eukprot:XP_002680673.1 dihydrolipoamide acyltransferase [Naegleria gruberi strain NEG-M]
MFNSTRRQLIRSIKSSSIASSSSSTTTSLKRGYAITKIPLPSLSPTMTSGEIVQWLKKEGDKISVGDSLCEIRTDKSVLDFESTEEGILGKIIIPGGTKNIEMGATIGYLVDKLDEIKNIPTTSTPVSSTPASTPTTTTTSTTPASTSTTSSSACSNWKDRMNHSAPLCPSVLRILNENTWIHVKDIKATGRGGRLTKTDLINYMNNRSCSSNNAIDASPRITINTTSTPQPTTTTTATPTPQSTKPTETKPQPTTAATAASSPIKTAAFNDIETTQIRKIIASRLLESKQNIPHSYYTIQPRIDKLLSIKNKLAEKGVKASVNDIIIYCAARALQRVPECNVIFNLNGHTQVENIDISFAVATPTGLITPIIPKTNTKSIEQIAASVKELGKRAKENKLKPEEFQGGSFCISNLGMFGIQHFAAVINPPHGIILAIGGSEKKPIFETESLDLDNMSTEDISINDVQIGTFMSVTAACDSRAIDGVTAGKFMKVLREELEFDLSL